MSTITYGRHATPSAYPATDNLIALYRVWALIGADCYPNEGRHARERCVLIYGDHPATVIESDDEGAIVREPDMSETWFSWDDLKVGDQ